MVERMVKKKKRISDVPTRRNLIQYRFSESDSQELAKLAVQRGYVDIGDMGNQAKMKARVERMIVMELLGREPNE
jgi:hypothetical protein